MFKQDKNKLCFFYDGEKVVIEPWGESALRVRATKNHDFTGENWALEERDDSAEITINDVCAEIVNGDIKAVLTKTGVITFYNGKNEMLLKENWKRRLDEPCLSTNYEGRELKSINGDSWHAVVRFIAKDNEKIFGMGQYQEKYLDKKGCILDLCHRNSQASVPFYISNQNYGFLWNNPAIGKVTFGKNGTEWVADSTKEIDYWVVSGSPKKAEEVYTSVTGRAPKMPEYGLGFWQCKLRYKTQDELMAAARKHKALGLPMDVIVADFFHWTQQGEYKFDPQYWPDVEGMCRELDEMGIKLMVSVWPTVDTRSENYNEMLEKGYLVRNERGARMQMQFCGIEAFYDTTNPDARKFVWDKCKENYWDKGVRLFWLDEAEPEYSVYDYDNYRYHIGSDLETGNIYPRCYAQGFYEGMKDAGCEAPLNLLRCAWVGSAKYGALVWSGDIDSTFDSFQRQLRAGLSMAVAGIPWWTTDIGGFHGGDIRDPEFHELLMRWFAFGCFSPVFRLHGYRYPMTGIDGYEELEMDCPAPGAENEVWSYGEDCFKIMKKYLLLRERLRPYIREQMDITTKTGMPIMRPLFMDFDDDEKAWDIDDEYMFGSDILVCPVIEKGAQTRKVYLPKGAKWTDALTGKEYEGGMDLNADAPIDVIPLFLKNGAKLPIMEEE